MKQKFKIKGMTCSACVAHVEKAVNKLKGIEQVEVTLLTNTMQVSYEEEIVKEEQILQAVKDAGYIAIREKGNSSKQTGVEEEIKQMKHRLILSFACLIPLMYIAMFHMLGDFLVPEVVYHVFHGVENSVTFVFAQFLLLLPILYANRSYFITGFKMLWKKTPNMDSLIAIGAMSATVYGIYNVFRIGIGLGYGNLGLVEESTMNIYFESAGTILTLITLGKYLETKSKGKTSQAINKLLNLAPRTAIVERKGIEIELPIEEVIVEDMVIVKPGMSIPVDGMVVEGKGSVDESSITGESIPVEKQQGDVVIGATINRSGYLKVKTQKIGQDTTLAQIVQLVEQANSSKAPIAKLADKISGVFVPIVIAIAVIATIVWLLLGYSFEFALAIGIAVLVISCPCALGLATPVSIMVGTGKAAQNGILVKSAQGLEMAHSITTVVLDKTGTITQGKPKVTNVICLKEQEEKSVLQILGSMESKSEHPLAKAILEKAKQDEVELLPVTEFENTEGMGIKAIVQGKRYLAGNRKMMQEEKMDTKQVEEQSHKYEGQGKTVIYLAQEQEIIAILAIADTVKETSKQAIEELKKMGLKTIMLTGDNLATANYIKEQVGVDQVIAEVLPHEKERQIRAIQEQGEKVLMVGDGINDAPALARADLGIAIGAGTDIAIESAEIILMKSDLLDLVTTIALSKSVFRNIKMNLFWAFFYNCIGIPLAAGVFYLSFGLTLNPMFAATAMSFSSVCVVLNALRLTRFKTNYQKKEERKEMINMKETIYINGMSCNHCKMSVEKALMAIEGVTRATVNLEEKKAEMIVEKEILDETIEDAIREAGFEVEKIEK